MSIMLTNRRILRPFRPDQIPNLAVWLDSADGSTITVDGSSNVDAWKDKSTNGYLFGQTGTLRPVWGGANTMNGLPSILFDGVDDYIVASTTTPITQPDTAFIVCRSASNTSFRTLIDSSSGVSRQAIYTNSGAVSYTAGRNRTGTSTMTIGQNSLIFATFNGSASSVVRSNGVISSSADPGLQSVETALRVGAGYNGISSWSGLISEVIIYNGLLSDSRIAAVHAYLRSKWGTP